jgi:hypothetical protein
MQAIQPIQAIAPIAVGLFDTQRGLSEHVKVFTHSLASSVVENTTLSCLFEAA